MQPNVQNPSRDLELSQNDIYTRFKNHFDQQFRHQNVTNCYQMGGSLLKLGTSLTGVACELRSTVLPPT